MLCFTNTIPTGGREGREEREEGEEREREREGRGTVWPVGREANIAILHATNTFSIIHMMSLYN